MSEIYDGKPAFPSLNAEMNGIDSDGNERWETEPSGGLTIRQYAAIKLKVPDSGDKWLDEMIERSRRDDVAAMSMQGLSVAFPSWTHNEIARAAYGQADAMLEARK